MMHLTADTSTDRIQRSDASPAEAQALEAQVGEVVQIKRRRLFATALSDRRSALATSVFFSHTPNFLENRYHDFHYSVIGQFATVLLASGYIGCQALNDDDAASRLEVEVSASRTESASSLARKIVTFQPNRATPIGPVTLSNR